MVFESTGTLFTVEEAEKVGLIDQVVEPEQLEDTARTEMQKWLKIPGKEYISPHKAKNIDGSPSKLRLKECRLWQ